MATVTTLFFVPIVYSLLRKRQPNRIELEYAVVSVATSGDGE